MQNDDGLVVAEDPNTIPDIFLLKSTGKPYDGVDKLFDIIIRMVDFEFYLLGKVPGHIDGSTFPKSEVYIGEPLFHIISISSICESLLLLPEVDNEVILKINLLVPYIIKWMDSQTEKLVKHLESPNKKLDLKDHSEFHLAQECFDKTKDSLITDLALVKINEAVCFLYKHVPDNKYLCEIASSFYRLEKILRKSYESSPPSLSKKKNMPAIYNVLNVIKFENYLIILATLVNQEEYVLAEAYANKCLLIGQKLHQSQRLKIVCHIAAFQAYIAFKTNDIDMLLSSIDKVLNLINGNLETKLKIEKEAHFSKSCEYAGAYFDEEIDKAIKYYIEAQSFSNNSVDRLKYSEKLKSLVGPLVVQLTRHAKSEEFTYILDDVKCYPSNSRFDVYFSTEKYFELFCALVTKNKIKCVPLSGIKNATAFVIDYEFNVDIFKAILNKVKDQQAKDHIKEIKQLKTIKKDLRPTVIEESQQIASPKHQRVEGESGRHPKASQSKTKKTKALVVPIISVSKWGFLEQRRPKPLERVEFLKAKKVFDPENRNGIVTLSVNGMTGRWFACMNPLIIEQIDNIKKDEGSKLAAKFNTNSVLANDLCVPCYKEMETKSKELGTELPYVFKIRLLGGEGLANVRVYAEVIDQRADGKKLVAFTAINPKSHAKHTRPIHFDMPEELDVCEIGEKWKKI